MKKNWILVLVSVCATAVLCANRSGSLEHTVRQDEGHTPTGDIIVIDTILTGSPETSEIIIDYGKVEGYGVTVRILPENRLIGNTCQAIVDLEYDGMHRLILHNGYSDPYGADTLSAGTVLKREYRLPEGAGAGHLAMDIFSDMPFFFLDVDFDGNKELVLTLTRQGQRWSNAYQPIRIDYDYLYDNLKEIPFTKLDDHSEIDYDRCTIKLYAFSGAGSWNEEVFTYQRPDGNSYSSPKVISHVESEFNTWDESNPKKRIIVERRDTSDWMSAKELVR